MNEFFAQHLSAVTDKVWFAVSSSKKESLFSKAIKLFQKTNYNHTLVIYYSLDTEECVVANAHGVGAQLDTLEQFIADSKVVHMFEKDVNPKESLALRRLVVELDGVRYSWMQILGIGGASIFRLGRALFPNGKKEMICSEYGDRLAVAAGLPSAVGILNKGLDLLNPKDNVKAWDMLVHERDDFRRLK